jgi:hypothetical protein
VVGGAEAASLTLVGAGGALSTPECTGALAKQMDALLELRLSAINALRDAS